MSHYSHSPYLIKASGSDGRQRRGNPRHRDRICARCHVLGGDVFLGVDVVGGIRDGEVGEEVGVRDVEGLGGESGPVRTPPTIQPHSRALVPEGREPHAIGDGRLGVVECAQVLAVEGGTGVVDGVEGGHRGGLGRGLGGRTVGRATGRLSGRLRGGLRRGGSEGGTHGRVLHNRHDVHAPYTMVAAVGHVQHPRRLVHGQASGGEEVGGGGGCSVAAVTRGAFAIARDGDDHARGALPHPDHVVRRVRDVDVASAVHGQTRWLVQHGHGPWAQIARVPRHGGA